MPSDQDIEAQIDAAYERGRLKRETTPQVTSASYDVPTGFVRIAMSNGARFEFPANLAQGLRGATAEQLAQVEVMGSYGLHWEALDADLLVPELLMGVFGTKAWMSELARQAGRISTPKKVAASRANGAKGGRPRRIA